MQDNVTDSPNGKSANWMVWPHKLFQLMRFAWPIVIGLVGALFGVFIYVFFFPAPIPPTQAEIDESIVAKMSTATPPPAYSVEVYQMVLPSLVIIQTENAPSKEDEDDIGIGTGVIISENSDILTALHVVSDANKIELFFADGSQSTAVVASTQPENDIAVLQPIQPPGLIVPAILGNPNSMQIGDEAYAVGNPLGLAGSMSAGVISGFDRSFPLNDEGDRLEGLIQFDAPVNPGNSGGPLLNRNGHVIGIVTALANPTGREFFTGIGFAVPIDAAVTIVGGPSY